jgi:hypothetical protein
MRNNPVYQVLAPSGNQALLAADKTVEDLLPGQLGIFSRLTGKTANPVNPGELTGIFFGLGVDTDLDGKTDDVFFSAGQFIQAKGLLDMGKKPYVAPVKKVVEITDLKAVPSTEYGFRFYFVSGELNQIYGYQVPTMTFMVRTPDPSLCPTCENCGGCNCVILAKLLSEQINLNSEHMVVAEMIDEDGTVITDWDAFVADEANAEKCLGLRISVNSEKIWLWCQIPMNYNWLREVDFEIAPVGGFQQTPATLEVTQQLVYEQGAAYDLKWYEYFAGGWNGRPGVYRQFAVNGLPQRGFYYGIDDTKKYNQYTFLYNLRSVSGWFEHDNNLETIVAIATTDTATKTAFETAINDIRTVLQKFPGDAFQPLA